MVKRAVGRGREPAASPKQARRADRKRHQSDEASVLARPSARAAVAAAFPQGANGSHAPMRFNAETTSHAGRPTTFEYEPSIWATAKAPNP